MSILLTAAEMYAADEKTIREGTSSQTLMERAASAALEVLEAEFDTSCVLFACGGGNNGGDGLAMARFFAQKGGNARVLYLGAAPDGAPDAACMSTECARQFSLLPPSVPICTEPCTEGVTAIVDAVFGIGLTRPVTGKPAQALQTLAASGIPVLALDIPSGIHADTGAVMSVALPATVTVAIAAQKWGHFLLPGALLCGKVVTVDIGIPVEAPVSFLMKKSDISSLPPRPIGSHKGTFGRVLVIGGSYGMSGAGYLAAKAAYRAGAGLVEILAHKENRVIYQTQLPEALLTLYDPDEFDLNAVLQALRRADAIAIGMGLSQSDAAKQLLLLTLAEASVPVILDADALNMIAADPHLADAVAARTAPTILTPHLGELSRLTGIAIPSLRSDLPAVTVALARKFAAVAVVKDARTVISDGFTSYLNTYGNSGMSTGGSGDVLAGVIASLAAQGVPATDAARLGVLAHALAGDAAKSTLGEHGLMASDIADGLCRVFP